LTGYEHLFDTGRVLTAAELEGLRRSAAMAPLGQADTARLIEAYTQLAAERAQIAAVLARLPRSWAEVRAALNELQRFTQ
jgi:hypothetical protein